MPPVKIESCAVLDKLSKLKIDKSPGPDDLHPRVLYELHQVISKPLTNLFNSSIQEGKLPIPNEWKTAQITAIHKNGNKNDVKNYRPISLTCIICKILESIIKDNITQHFIQNSLFSSKQFGFIKGRSTSVQLINILNIWTRCLEDGGQIDAVYTDFEKAFDKVPHKRLISKLNAYGLDNKIIIWIENFLQNRKQRVNINGSYSNWHSVLSGIPQGSILGPLLFIVYINDLPKVCEPFCEMFLFADDAKIFKHVKTNSDQTTLQKGCNELQKWSDEWLLNLNIIKCKSISVSVSGNTISYDYSLGSLSNNRKLDHVEDIKDLGVIIDSKLKFNLHISDKINKAYRMLGIIKRNFKQMDKFTLIQLYKTFVRCQLEYAVSVWSPHNKGLIKNLEKVQRRATKLVKQCKHMKYSDRLKYLKFPTLLYRRHRGDMIEVYKIVSGKYDEDIIPDLIKSNNNTTRGNSLKLNTIRTKYDIRKFSFTVRVINIWNSLPDNVVQAENINCFKNRLDRFWSNQNIIYDYKAQITGPGIIQSN